MCLIAIKPRGAHLSEDEIRHDYSHNPHGAGFMYAENGLVHWEKGFFSVNSLIKRWNEVVSDDMVAALHTRIATHGAHNTALCHPFPLDGSDMFRSSGSAPLVMMHNGIIPDRAWKEWEKKDDSDTSAYARKLIPILKGQLPDEKTVKTIEDEGGWSRFVFLRGDGEFVTAGEWCESGGILFSNSGHLKNARPLYTPPSYAVPSYDYFWYPEQSYTGHTFPDDYELEAERYRNLFDGYDVDWDHIDSRARRMGLDPIDEVYSYGDLKGSYSSDKHYYVNLNTNYSGACDVYSYCTADDGFDYERDVVFALDEAYID